MIIANMCKINTEYIFPISAYTLGGGGGIFLRYN